MYEELVKELRNRRICIQQSGSLDDFPLLGKAAKAIEELMSEVGKYRHAAFVIGETCVDASKQHLTPEAALQKIRENIYYNRHE